MKALAKAGAVALALLILSSLMLMPWENDIEQGKTDTLEVSNAMFDDFNLAFLLIAFILFSAMLGGIFLAKEELMDSREMKRRERKE